MYTAKQQLALSFLGSEYAKPIRDLRKFLENWEPSELAMLSAFKPDRLYVMFGVVPTHTIIKISDIICGSRKTNMTASAIGQLIYSSMPREDIIAETKAETVGSEEVQWCCVVDGDRCVVMDGLHALEIYDSLCNDEMFSHIPHTHDLGWKMFDYCDPLDKVYGSLVADPKQHPDRFDPEIEMFISSFRQKAFEF